MAGVDFPKRPNTSSFLFASTFQGENALRTGEWVLSEDPKYEGQESRVRVEPCNLEGGVFAGDYGLLLDESHKHYAVGASFPKSINNAGKDLVVQYEVQVRDGANCGGAYVKLLREAAAEGEERETETDIMKALNNDSPYSVMFGPDKCFRDTNKVHFIFQHENPKTKDWEEKHFKDAPKIKDDGGFHVYTLHIKTDNTFDLYIDTEVVSSGSLMEDMKPPLVPPEEIDDPEDEQPDDWVTEAKIPDPEAVKPDDWDEDAPRKIVDEDAVMPEGWLEDAEEIIPDPSATKPDDWDDEADGEWEPVMIANPACREGPGCGKWEKPLIPNPAYKGKWSAPMITNPEYVGKWKPAKIPNPAYFDIQDMQPSNMAPITGLAVEIWTVDGGIWLDNFVVGDDISAALELAESTWRHKFDAFEAVAATERKRKDAETAAKMNKDSIASKIESASRSLESASRSLIDKARPLLPNAAAPPLDMAAENPLAGIATVLAGILAMVLLFTLKGGRQVRGRRSKKSAKKPASVPAPTTDDAASAAPAEGNGEGEEEEGEEDAAKDDDEDNGDKAAAVADSDASAPISST